VIAYSIIYLCQGTSSLFRQTLHIGYRNWWYSLAHLSKRSLQGTAPSHPRRNAGAFLRGVDWPYACFRTRHSLTLLFLAITKPRNTDSSGDSLVASRRFKAHSNMQQQMARQEEEEQFTDGVQEYAHWYGGPAVRDLSRPRYTSTKIHTEQASKRQLDTGNGRRLATADAHVRVSSQAPELDVSRLPDRSSHRTLSKSYESDANTQGLGSSSVSPGSFEISVRKSSFSQAPEVRPSQLPEHANRQLSRSCSTTAGLHPVTPDTTLEDARSEVISRLDPTIGDEILRRLRSSSSPVPNAAKPERRRSMVTSLRQAFIRTRPISPDPLIEVLETVARGGSLPLVKATIALIGEPGMLPPKENYAKTALRFAVRLGHADVVDYLLWKGVELVDDQHADIRVEGLHSDLHASVNYALLESIQASQVELALHLVLTQGANAFLPGTTHASDGSHCASTSFAAIVKMKSEKDSVRLLKAIFNRTYFQHVCTTTLVDGSSLVSSRMPQMICEGLVLCIKGAKVEAVTLLLNSQVTEPYIALLMQNETDLLRLNFEIRAFGYGAWDRTTNSSCRKVRIFKLLVEKSIQLRVRDHMFISDIFIDALDRVVGKAISADGHEGVDMMLKIHPGLLRKKLVEDGSSMSPLALAIVKEAPRTADVLLHNGAQPCDWANSKGTALQLATSKAALGSRAAQKILVSMLTMLPNWHAKRSRRQSLPETQNSSSLFSASCSKVALARRQLWSACTTLCSHSRTQKSRKILDQSICQSSICFTRGTRYEGFHLCKLNPSNGPLNTITILAWKSCST